MQGLDEVGMSMNQVTDRLLDEGVALFLEAFQSLLDAIERRAVEAQARDIKA